MKAIILRLFFATLTTAVVWMLWSEDPAMYAVHPDAFDSATMNIPEKQIDCASNSSGPDITKTEKTILPNILADKRRDKRMQLDRPPMTAASSSFLNTIYDIEETFSTKMTDRCSTFGGRKLIDQLLASKLSHITNGASQIYSYQNQNMDIYLAHNVSVVVDLDATTKKISQMRMQVDGDIDDQQARLKPKGGHVLNGLTHSIESGNLDHCDSFIEHPIMLVDSKGDHNNWWFFMIELIKHFIEFTVVQPQVSSVYGNDDVQVLHTSEDADYKRSFTDAYEYLFSDHRGMDAAQLQEIAASSSSGNQVTLCLRQVFWSPGHHDGGREILINKKHPFDNCFSSIVTAFAAHLKAAVHIPTLPTPPKPRVVWVARDTSQKANGSQHQKQRIFLNQPELIEYLKQKCNEMGIEFVVADFYGDKFHTSFEEQAHLVSRTNIMMGIHGAGLNMFMFLPFNSVVVEVHMGSTSVQKNSVNTVTHIGGGKYLQMMGQKQMQLPPVWVQLKHAIDVWYDLNGRTAYLKLGRHEEITRTLG
jgi:hypothetical protein